MGPGTNWADEALGTFNHYSLINSLASTHYIFFKRIVPMLILNYLEICLYFWFFIWEILNTHLVSPLPIRVITQGKCALSVCVL